MSFNIGSIPQAVLNEIARGLTTKSTCYADEIATEYSRVTTMGGTLPRLTSVSTVARADDTGLAPLAEATEHVQGAASTTYQCLAYVGKFLLPEESVNDMRSYGMDMLAEDAERAMADSNLKVDLAMSTVLASSSLNNVYDCNSDGSGEWDDYTASKPLEDLLAARFNKAPGADCIVMGPRVFRTLLGHPDVVAEVSNFNAGQLDQSQLANLLSRKLGIPAGNIFLIDKFYNTAAQGQALSTAYVHDAEFWLGHREDLIKVDPRDSEINNRLTVRYDDVHRCYVVQYTRYVSIIRPTKELGCRFTSIFT